MSPPISSWILWIVGGDVEYTFMSKYNCELIFVQMIKNFTADGTTSPEKAAWLWEQVGRGENLEDLRQLVVTEIFRRGIYQSEFDMLLSVCRDKEAPLIEYFHEVRRAILELYGRDAVLSFTKEMKHAFKAIPAVVKALNPYDVIEKVPRVRSSKPNFSDEVERLIVQDMRPKDIEDAMIEWSKENAQHTRLVKLWMSAPRGEARMKPFKILVKSVRDRVRKLILNRRKKPLQK
jgi:hypothetical protein